MDMTLRVSGLRELRDRLRRLESREGRRVLYDAAKWAVEPIRRMARILVPVRTGALRRTIRASVSTRDWPQRISARVTTGRVSSFSGSVRMRDPRTGRVRIVTMRIPPHVYASWVERGHHIGRRTYAERRDQKHARISGLPWVSPRPRVDARPFMDPAFEQTGGAAGLVNRFAAALESWLLRLGV